MIPMRSLQLLAEHTIDCELLPEIPVVLDAGSRGFGFSNRLLDLRPKARVIAVEADPDLFESHPHVTTFRVALVGDPSMDESDYHVFPPPHGECANSIVLSTPGATTKRVPCRTLSWIMLKTGIVYWDLVKLDIEGGEFGVLENWPGPVAAQITVEFHDYFDPERWNDQWFARLLSGPLCQYEAVQNDFYPIGAGCYGHWNSLFILKSACTS